MTDDEEARRLRAQRLRRQIARLREDEPGEPGSPRDFVEREKRRLNERADTEEDDEPSDAPPD